MASWYTPADIARERKLRLGKVLAWIRSGELLAVNMAEKRAGRPRWRISAEALEAFDAGRSNRAAMRAAPARKPRSAREGIVEFF